MFSGSKQDQLRQSYQENVKPGEWVVLPASIYVQTTAYQFRISSEFKTRTHKPDGSGYQNKSYDYEKYYSLNPKQSLTFTNRIREVDIDEQKVAYLEACIKNHMNFPIRFTKLECTGTKKAQFLGFMGYDNTTILEENSTLKLIAKFSMSSEMVRYKAHLV